MAARLGKGIMKDHGKNYVDPQAVEELHRAMASQSFIKKIFTLGAPAPPPTLPEVTYPDSDQHSPGDRVRAPRDLAIDFGTSALVAAVLHREGAQRSVPLTLADTKHTL